MEVTGRKVSWEIATVRVGGGNENRAVVVGGVGEGTKQEKFQRLRARWSLIYRGGPVTVCCTIL